MRIRATNQDKDESAFTMVAWGDWAIKSYQSIWLTMNRFVLLNGPTLEAFRNDFCTNVSNEALMKRPWILVPGQLPINLGRVAKLCRVPTSALEFSHLRGLPLKHCIFSSGLRFCPKCLDAGYHSALMSLEALRRCPIHDENLIDTCECGKPFPDGISQSIISGAGCCQCKRQELLNLNAARAPSISNGDVEEFSEYATWLRQCGSKIYLKSTSESCIGEDTDRAVQFWAKKFRTSVPYAFDSWSMSKDKSELVHKSSLKRASEKYTKKILANRGERKYRRFRRNLIQNSSWSTVHYTYSAICRYLRRHVIPPVHRWQRDLTSYQFWCHIPGQVEQSALVRAYLFFLLYGGPANFRKINGRPTSNKKADPSPVSPFSEQGFLPQFLDTHRDAEGLRWIRDRAEADYLWNAWKRCVARAASTNEKILEVLQTRPKVQDSVSHWSAGFKNGFYVLRVEVVKYPSVPVKTRRQISKEERAKILADNVEAKFKLLRSALPKQCLVFKGREGWFTRRGSLPKFPLKSCWFKKKNLFMTGDFPSLHYVIFPKDGKYVARTLELGLEVSDQSSNNALALLKMAVQRMLSRPNLINTI